jgi:hypothetical protein
MSNKTDLQLAMQAAYETAFGESTIPLNVGGIDFPTRPDNLTDRQLCAFLRYGKRGANDAYNSEAKVARDQGDKASDPKSWFPDWLDEWGTNKPRGGGAKQSPTIKGWIAYFNSKVSKVKIQRDKKRVTCNGTNLEEFRDILTKRAIQPSITKHLATMEEPAQRDWIKTKLADAIATHKPKVIETYEADQTVGEGVGWYIKQEKIKLEGGSTESDVIHIEATFDNI